MVAAIDFFFVMFNLLIIVFDSNEFLKKIKNKNYV